LANPTRQGEDLPEAPALWTLLISMSPSDEGYRTAGHAVTFLGSCFVLAWKDIIRAGRDPRSPAPEFETKAQQLRGTVRPYFSKFATNELSTAHRRTSIYMETTFGPTR